MISSFFNRDMWHAGAILSILFILSMCWLQPAMAQQIPGGAKITYPLSGDVLGADDNTIYFSPVDERYIEWRITIGYSPGHTGLFDSGNVLFSEESWELPIGTMPVDGRPVTLRFWQRTATSPWLYYDIQYTNASQADQSSSNGSVDLNNQGGVEVPVVDIGAEAASVIANDVVQSLSAVHRNGQTFITWLELSNDAGYHVYRHTSPITAENLSSAQRLTEKWGALDSNTSINTHAHSELPRTYIIEDLGEPLGVQTGLFVYTAPSNGPAYYAVTAQVNGKQYGTIALGDNSLVDPVVEQVAEPKAVLALSLNNGLGRVYTQYMDYAKWNPTFNGYRYNYSVALPAGYDESKEYPLMIYPHAYSGEFAIHKQSEYDWEVIQLFPSDPAPQHLGIHTWWYGYAADHNYLTDGPVPTRGVIENFTEQRLMRSVREVLEDPRLRVDAQRLHVVGHSMGGSGAVALGMRYGGVISGIFASRAMTNYRDSPTFQEDFKILWGARSSNLPIVNRGVYSDMIARYNGTGVWDWMDHQEQVVKMSAEQMAYFMVSQGKYDDTIEWLTQGEPLAYAFNKAKVGFSAGFRTVDHSWTGFNGVVYSLFGLSETDFAWRYPSNLSFPSIQDASNSGDLAPGPVGDDDYNTDIEWATRYTSFADEIVDESAYYSISLRSLSSQQKADITPRNTQNFKPRPGSNCRWRTVSNSRKKPIAEGSVRVDKLGLVTVRDVLIATDRGTALSIDCR